MRVAAGPEGASMAAAWRGLGDDREAFAEWTDRVAAGELPPDRPERPVGVERNLVVTVYDWGTKFDGRTDAVAADLRDGTVNPHGPVYMVSRSNDILTMLDPVENSSRNLIVPSESPVTRDNTPVVALLGRRAGLEAPVGAAQPGDGQRRARVVERHRAGRRRGRTPSSARRRRTSTRSTFP